MTKYIVKREMPGFNVGDEYDPQTLLICVKTEKLLFNGWIEEVKEPQTLAKKFLKCLDNKIELGSSWLPDDLVKLAAEHFREKLDKAVKDTYGYGEFIQKISKVFDE